MFHRLQLENFKAWKKADMRLAPLTGLFGTNSSGKTSILQFLLMLKQTVESSDRALVLNLNGNYVELGTFRDMVSNFDTNQSLKFSIDYEAVQLGNSGLVLVPCTFDCQLSLDENDKILLDFYKYYYQLDEEFYSLTRDEKIYIFQSSLSREKLIGIGKPEHFYSVPDDIIRGDGSMGLEILFKGIHYLGPLREYPKRTYIQEFRSQIGSRGEYFVGVILNARTENETIEDNEGTSYSLETYLAKWLRDLGLIQDFKIDSITEGGRLFEVRVRQTEKSPYVLLTDVGFGVSQILPVLTMCYYTPKGSILLMEQPEIHLHPRVQAGLADVFIDAIQKRGVQIILESHSEHLLRRLQLRIAQEKFSSDEAALYFCEIKEGYSELRDLQLDEFGNIKNWPDNFFGDEMSEVFQMSEAIAERKKKAKLNGK